MTTTDLNCGTSMKKKLGFLIGLFFCIVPALAGATDFVRYVDANVTDTNVASARADCTTYNPTTGLCSGGTSSAYASLRDVNAFIDSLGSSDTATIYFQRGDTWTFTSNSDALKIDHHSVTLDAFGSGNKPVLDGTGSYPTGLTPSGVAYNFAIHVGETSDSTHNVWIRNLEIKDMSPGGGIIFKGIDEAYYEGGGGIQYCTIDGVGWSAISLFRCPLVSGRDPIMIENNTITDTFKYRNDPAYTTGGPQAINTMDGYTYGHECRFNNVYNCMGEGIGASGFDVVEYNVVSDTRSPSIYLGGSSRTTFDESAKFSTIVRYNLVWRNSSGSHESRAGGNMIRLDDEGWNGVNIGIAHEIYGNIVIGGSGISLRNNPLGASLDRSPSKFGSVKVYNNTLIDNTNNIEVGYSDRFASVEVLNNTFIISSDAESECQHIGHWWSPSWTGWTWGPNFFYGDKLPSDPFFHSQIDATGDPKLPKSSGWRSITRLSDISFSHFAPLEGSALIDNPKAEALSSTQGYVQNFLTSGTEHRDLPNTIRMVLANQNDYGKWDFGAVVLSLGGQTYLNPPSGLRMLQ